MLNSPMFDVFLAHNNVDKPQVRTIAKELRKRGLNPWLDEEQIAPGELFQDVIHRAIPQIKSAAVCIGSQGLGKWQVMELHTLTNQFINKGIKVIPLLLPGVDSIPENLLFLQQLNWFSFERIDDANAFYRLEWGIRGKKPKQSRQFASSSQSESDGFELKLEKGIAKVKLVVKRSPIIIEVNGIDAPITASNFVDLVQRGFYNGLVFHRVVKSPQPFVVQGGDPLGNGTGGFTDPETGKKRSIPLEIKLTGDDEPTYSKGLGQQSGIMSPDVVLKHNRGAVAMARSSAPDSASSQFYIALAQLDFLDGDYAVFGQVLEGMDIVDSINQGDTIDSAEVIEGIENLKQ